MIKRILILGHDGFIGSRLMTHFNQVVPDMEIAGLSYPELDLTEPTASEQLAPFLDPETVVLFLSGIKRQFGEDLATYKKNISMVENFCEAAIAHPPRRILYFSSAAVYGEDIHNLAITEEAPICPTSYYGLAKYTAERLLTLALGSSDTSLVMLRPPTVYGPGDSGGTYGPVGFLAKAKTDRALTLWGDGSELRDFVYIDDLLQVVQELALNRFSGTLNIATGKSTSFKSMLEHIETLLGEQIAISTRPRSKDKVDNAFITDKLKKACPNSSFIEVAEGIQRLHDAS